MNKTQFIESLSAHFEGNKKQAGEALDAVIDTIQREVTRGEKVALTGFASFEKIVREARSGRNPATGAKIRIKKKSVPKVTVGADFKNIVSGAKKLPRKTAAAATAAAGAAARTTGAAKKTAAKKTAAKKTAAKKTAAKKTAAKKTAAKKTAAKKAPAKKTAAKKTAAKKAPAKKTAAKKSTARKTARKG